jgi:AAA+ ATPase superfamily predicted ATPase
VYPNHSLLERGETGQVMTRVREQLDQYVGPAFEALCQEAVWRMQGTPDSAARLGFTPSIVGRWWNRQQEIDVAAFGEGTAMLGECKWSRRAVGVNVLDDLKQKVQFLIEQQEWDSVRYALFSRSGFTPALQKRAEQEAVLLVDLQELAEI